MKLNPLSPEEEKIIVPKDTRYCVNSLSMKFVAATGLDKQKPSTNTEQLSAVVVFGGGCFWCTEAAFKMIKGVISVVPGYAGGSTKNPSYEEVCTGKTGHAEVVQIAYDPRVIAYEGLLDVFFATHDPTTRNRQGHDLGTQYRSIILYLDDLQKEIAENYIAGLGKQRLWDSPIITEIKPLTEFFEAEEYHHNYYNKNPDAAYCQSVITPKLAQSRKKLSHYLNP